MVIFGAGASYDSAASLKPVPTYVEPMRPPLAKDLFSRRDEFAKYAQAYPPLPDVIDRLRGPNSNSIEAKLQSWRDEAESGKWPERFRQLAAVKYYLRDVLRYCTENWSAHVRSATNYGSLLDDIAKWHFDQKHKTPVCLVTLNYDLLLESALTRITSSPTFDYSAVDNYLTSHPVFSVFKLHGSINWARIVNVIVSDVHSPRDIIDRAAKLLTKPSDEFTISTDPSEVRQQHRLLVPAIAIPVQEKGTFECPDSHVVRLKSLIPEIRKILVIGWRGAEMHFLDHLRNGLNQLDALMVVDQDEAAANNIAVFLLKRLGRTIAQTRIEAFVGGFSDLIYTNRVEQFLYS